MTFILKALETKESLAKTVRCYWICATIYLLYTYAQPSSGRGKKASVFANRQHREAGRREHSRTDNTWTGRARTRRRDEQKGEAEDIIRERRDGAEREGEKGTAITAGIARCGQVRQGQGGAGRRLCLCELVPPYQPLSGATLDTDLTAPLSVICFSRATYP